MPEVYPAGVRPDRRSKNDRARKRRRAFGLRHNASTSMPANVYIGFHLSPSPRHQYRHAGFIVGKELPRSRHVRRMTNDDRKLPKQDAVRVAIAWDLRNAIQDYAAHPVPRVEPASLYSSVLRMISISSSLLRIQWPPAFPLSWRTRAALSNHMSLPLGPSPIRRFHLAEISAQRAGLATPKPPNICMHRSTTRPPLL